jgi:proteasome activator subunit 4
MFKFIYSVRAGIITADEELRKSATDLASSTDPVQRHSGVLALSSIVLAFPYSVPDFLPAVLMRLCKHASEKQPIFGTVKRALSDFKVCRL